MALAIATHIMFFSVVHAAIAIVFAAELLLSHPCVPKRFSHRPSVASLLSLGIPALVLIALAAFNDVLLLGLAPFFAFVFGFLACARRARPALPLLALAVGSALITVLNSGIIPVSLLAYILLIDVVVTVACIRCMLRDAFGVIHPREVDDPSSTLLAAPNHYGAVDIQSAVHSSAAESGTLHASVATPVHSPLEALSRKWVSFMVFLRSRLPAPVYAALCASIDVWGSGADDITERVDNSTRTVPPNVRTASLLGILGFHWMNPLVVLGRTTNLNVSDMPVLAPHLRSLATGPQKFNVLWREEARRGGDYRLWRALARAFGGKLLLGGVLKFFNDICVFLNPLILQQVIRHLQYASTHPDDPNVVRKGVLLSISLMVVFTSQSLFFQHYFGNNIAVQAQVQGSLVTAVYTKSLRLSAEARSQFASGFIHNLMATDSRTLADLTLYVHTMWSGVEQIIISLVLLVGMLGLLPTFAGIGVILLSIPAQKELIGITRRVREQASAWTDDRVKIVSEALSDMRIVKLMAWESSFIKRITDARIGELKLVRLALNVQAATYGLLISVPVGLSMVTFGTFALIGGVLDAAVVFPAIALFSVLRAPMIILPATIISIARSAAAVNRIQRFFDAEELQYLEDSEDHAVDKELFTRSAADIVAIDAAFAWDRNFAMSVNPTLSKVSCAIPSGSLTCIVGPTAAGKSTFLGAIIGEVELVSGRIGMRPGVRSALCSQTPFIRNATVRDNVLFGLPLDMERYRRTLRVCNLLPDLLTLPAGDLTEIGDRGTNLSGGQKARLSLARAVYSQHEVVLMDSPLAAVDAHVAHSIFNNCIVNEMKGRTRLMTTNSMNFASSPDVDYVVVLKDGEMVEFGRRNDLMADPFSHFSKMVASEYVEDAPSKDDSEDTAQSETKRKSESQTSDSSTVSPSEKSHTHDESGIKNAAELADKLKIEHLSEIDRNRRGELFRREGKEVGKVKPRHYIEYMNAAGGIKWAVFIVFLAVAGQTLSMMVNVWLSFWSERSRVQPAEVVMSEQTRNLVIYISFCAGTIAITAGQMFVFASASVRASVWLHEKLVTSVFGAPMSFFDTTPTGRIVNRFNASIDRIDNSIIFSIRSVLGLTLTLASTVLLIMITLPSFVFIFVPAAFIFFIIRESFRRTVIDLRRLESVSRSPLYSHFGETLDGVMTIRAYGASDRMMSENRDLTDRYITTNFTSNSCNRWLTLRLEFVTSILVFGVSTIAVLSYRTVSPELSGLALSYAMEVVSSLGWYVRQLTETESYFSSIEQVSEYTTIPPFAQEEKKSTEVAVAPGAQDVETLRRNQSWGLVSERLVHQILVDQSSRPVQRWPRRGHIKLTNVTMRYRPGLEPALRNLSLEIMPGWHVGIVGRTGAGKSSLAGTLFRLQEIENGTIHIDGQDIAELRLRDLRRSLSVIAQEPVLFSGTIRSNLDMTGSHDEEEVQRAFDKCGLKDTTSNVLTLESEVSEGGANFSAGQRQLLCLGRALLRDSMVLVLDEATASLDDFTDRKLGETIHREMGHCTIITIAHRLHTVMRSTRVCVLDKGRVVEFDEPRALLERVPKSTFARMVEETGPNTSKYLRSLAYMPRVPSNLYSGAQQAQSNGDVHLRDDVLGAFRTLRSAVANLDSNEWACELQRSNMTQKTWRRTLQDMVGALSSIATDKLSVPSSDNLSITSISNLAEMSVNPEDERNANVPVGSPRNT